MPKAYLTLLLALSLLFGCSSSEGKITEVVIELDAEPSVAAKLTDLEVEVYDVEPPASAERPRRVDNERFHVSTGSLDVRLPFSFGVERRKADRFLLVVTGYAQGALVIEHKVHVRFVPEQSRRVAILLAEACYERNCSTPDADDWFTSTCYADRPMSCSGVETTTTAPVVAAEGDAGSDSEAIDGALVETSNGAREAGQDVTQAIDAALTSLSDGGTIATPPDAGRMDASTQSPSDAGSTLADAGGARDAAAPVDAGTTAPDAGLTTPDAGPGLDCYRVLAGGLTPYVVPAGQETSPQLRFDPPWGTATVQAITITPVIDKRAVVAGFRLFDSSSALLASWSSGMAAMTAPAGVGFYMPSSPASMRLEMHYHNLGTATVNDQSGFELCVTRTLRPQTAGTLLVGPIVFSVPAGASNYPVAGICTAQTTAPITLLGALPLTGNYATRATLVRASAPLFDVVSPAMNQLFVPFANVPVQNGENLTMKCTYNNPTTRNLVFGESSSDERCFAFISYYPRGALGCAPGP